MIFCQDRCRGKKRNPGLIGVLGVFLGLLLPQSSRAVSQDRSSLKIGDLVFYMDSLGKAEHVALFAGFDPEEEIPQVIHAVAEPHFKVISTQLRPSEIPYVIYRNKNRALSLFAYALMESWEAGGVPYDEKASELMDQFRDHREFAHPVEGTERLYEYARQMSVPNFYRRIKFAARRGASPVLPPDQRMGSMGRGLRCDEAVILAYQIEELADVVLNLFQWASRVPWVSDKYLDEEVLNDPSIARFVSQEYRDYLNRLNSKEEYPLVESKKRLNAPHQKFHPSIYAWNFEKFGSIEEFAQNFDTSLPLDAKITNPDVLLHHLRQDPQHWVSVGEVLIEPYRNSPERKLKWKNHLDELDEASKSLQQVLVLLVRDRATQAAKSDWTAQDFKRPYPRAPLPAEFDSPRGVTFHRRTFSFQ
ncbi:MAG: hypothetical protein ACO3A2_06195 [Bdellovibrionia bacterium]